MTTERNPVTLKKLRRLPHVFNKVLELPLGRDADVAVEERSGFLLFAAAIDGVAGVRLKAVEIHPGVVKVVVRDDRDTNSWDLFVDQLHIDTWRFRLPESARPELAAAKVVKGKLIVTVPKATGGCAGRLKDLGKGQ